MEAYLALGRGTGGAFIGIFEGWWSAGVDMLRLCNQASSHQESLVGEMS